MNQMIIVEDEPMMSDFLSNFIDWKGIGVEVIGVYSNGLDGLNAAISFNPDIVITDIKMPIMDGLTMIERIAEKGIKTKIIVLSAYSEFNLVKGAFHLGALDYILKSDIDEEIIKSTVRKMLNKDNKYENSGTDLLDMLYKQNIINRIIFGSAKLSDSKINLRLTDKNISVVVIKLLDYDYVLSSEWANESELLKYGLMNVCDEILRDENLGEAVLKTNDEMILLISDVGENQNTNEITENITKKICSGIKEVFNFKVCAGYCKYNNYTEKLSDAYMNAKNASSFTFVCGREKIANYNEIISSNVGRNAIDFDKKAEMLLKNMEKYDFSGVKQIIDECMSENVSLIQINRLYEFCDACYYEIICKVNQYQISSDKYKKLICSGTVNELKDYLNDEITRIESEENGTLVHRVKQYIDEKYFQNIDVDSMAEKFNVGVQKLRKEFKKKNNISLKQYLIEVRMNEAMRLIKTSDYRLYEIAEMVGYVNYENFNRMFFKFFATKPSDVDRS